MFNRLLDSGVGSSGVALCNSTMRPQSLRVGDTESVVSLQLEKILQIVKFLGRTWEDGLRPDVAMATKLHQALRQSLSGRHPRPARLAASLPFFSIPLLEKGFSTASSWRRSFPATDKSRAEKLLVKALRSRGSRPSSLASRPPPPLRAQSSVAFLGFASGPGFGATTRGRGCGHSSYPSQRPSFSRPKWGCGGPSSTKGPARHF